MNHDFFTFFLVFIIILCLALSIYVSFKAYQQRKQLKRYKNITLGMPEAVMLQIMGDGYNRSLLKNGRKKYEWRIKATSSGYSLNGTSVRSYSGVKKVTIYVKDGIVEEVRPYNV